MPKKHQKERTARISKFDKLLLVLSIYVVIELYVSTIYNYPPQIFFWLQVIDTIICGIFLFDFFRGLYRAENKWHFIRKNWIDFIASIPFLLSLRIGRVAKIFRVLRLLRSGKVILSIINKNDSLNTFRSLLFINVFLILIFTLSIHHLEKNINPAFESLEASFWWTLLTSISLGYLQDIPPITTEGKVLSVVLIVMGMVLFGTLISTITDSFVTEEEIDDDVKKMQKQLNEMELKLDRIEKMLHERNNSP